MKSFFDSQFSYCPLTWGTNRKVNLIHEDYLSSYAELLQKDN